MNDVILKYADEEEYNQCKLLGNTSKFTTDLKCFAHRWGWRKDVDDTNLLVAKIDKEVAGCQLFKILKMKPHLSMYYTVVSPNHKGKGIGGMLFGEMIRLAKESSKEEIRFSVDIPNEEAYNFYKGFGIYPAHADYANRNYMYHVSLRNVSCLGDMIKRRDKKLDQNRLMVDLRLHKNTGIYDWLNCSNHLHTDGELKFVTCWGTSNSGKTTMLKQLISHSSIVESYPPYFTLLDDGVVIVGVCNPALRSQGGDSLVARCSYTYYANMVDALWMVRDVRVLVAESYLYQGRNTIINLLLNDKEKRDREIFIFHTQISDEDLDKRLFKSRGKHLVDYKGQGKNFFEKRKQVEGTINKHRFDDNLNFIDMETVNTTIPERYEHFIKTIGLEDKWLKEQERIWKGSKK